MPLSYTKRIDIGFFVAFVLICSMALSVYACFQQMNHQKGRVDHTYTVISTLELIIGNLSDAQGSVRGYIITGREDYLAPFHLAMPKVDDELEDLRDLVSDNPEQKERYISLKQHVDTRVQIAEEAIDTYRKYGQKVAMDSIATGSGKREMDEIRVIVAEMINEEKRLLDIRKTAVENFSSLTMLSGAIGVLVCMAILLTVFFLIHREFRHRSRTEASLMDAVQQMERHNTETKLVSQMGDYLRGCREREEVYKVISDNMPLLFPQSFGSIAVFNNSRNSLIPAMTWGKLPDGVQLEFEANDCWALRQGRAHLVTDINSAPVCPHLEQVGRENVSFCLPMQAQGETIGQVYFGALAEEARHVGKHEMGTMRRITEQISLAIANLNLQQALKEQSIKDPLTKLYNRRYLDEMLARECSRAQRNNKALSVLIMDIDHFKKVNDTYGHDAGDAVLVAFAKLIQQNIRKEDIACRLGGEEFVLVLPDATMEQAVVRAEKICEATRAMSIKFQREVLNITVSIGVCDYPECAQMPEELIQNADSALYRAKNGGRNRVIPYDPEKAAAYNALAGK